MIAQISNTPLTPEEYLAFEEKSQLRHEYINGEIYAMSGGTDDHNTIALNAAIALRSHLRGSDCQVYMVDVKVQLENRNYYYPDGLVTCDSADRETSLYKRFPKLIIEVLSPSTEAFDRGDKFVDYQSFESLEEYVLISTKRRRVEVFRRLGKGLWTLQLYRENNEVVELKSVELKVLLSALYENVRLNVVPESGEAPTNQA